MTQIEAADLSILGVVGGAVSATWGKWLIALGVVPRVGGCIVTPAVVSSVDAVVPASPWRGREVTYAIPGLRG